MTDIFERKLKQLAKKESSEAPGLPEDYDQYIQGVLDSLPKRRRRRMSWKGGAVLAAALTVTLSVTVSAAVNYARQRMEALREEEKLNYYSEAQYSMPADSYSRELTEEETERMKSLTHAYYNEGVFPKGELVKISDSTEYKGKGIAFMASRSTFFLPEEVMSDEELLQIVDFRAKREYSLQEAAGKITAGDKDTFDVAQAPAEKSIELKSEDLEIVFNDNTQIHRAAGSAETVYLGNRSELYRIDAGSGSLSKMDIEAPEGMDYSIMAADAQGNLCILLEQEGLDRGNYGAVQLWKITPDGNVVDTIDLTKLAIEKAIIPQALAVDGSGNYYLSAMYTGETNQTVYVLDQSGSLISAIKSREKCSDTRALGRGRDGRIYGLMMKGEEWIPCVVTYDIENGRIDGEYEAVLPKDRGAYMTISAGTGSDLLIWGTDGVYSYNLGDDKAECTAALYELPSGAAVSILPDGRAVFIEDELITGQMSSEGLNARTKKTYLIKVD